ncbi:MAG: hypothetical protein KDB03_17125 [Planctomycetales bacterium]|nr:hypothetical protein [Planctomycetales bacterium]
MKKCKRFFCCWLTILGFSQSGYGDEKGQNFRVFVPKRVAVHAPVDEVVITHDESDSNQAFPPQTWSVSGNSSLGIVVRFSTLDSFVHALDPSVKRNVQLGLNLKHATGPATWLVSQATDKSDFQLGKVMTVVEAESDDVGNAEFDLRVAFVTESFGSFATGDYQLSVIGTISEK